MGQPPAQGLRWAAQPSSNHQCRWVKGVPRSLRFLQGAGVYGITELRARAQYDSPMPRGLKRFYGSGDLHFITCSCYQRRAWLGTPRRRDLFLRLLEETRTKYRFILLGDVIMPEHFHLLISEPQVGNPSTVLQVLKQRYAQQVLRERRRASKQPGLFEGYAQHVWQARFYDFNVWTERKRIEKLRYMFSLVPGRRERTCTAQPHKHHEAASQNLGCLDGIGTRPLQKPQGAGHPKSECPSHRLGHPPTP